MESTRMVPKTTLTFIDKAEALGTFFTRAGDAPRIVAFDEEVGCPLLNALAALEWTGAVGLLGDDDLLHAARLGGETAAAVVERRKEGRRVYVYLGPRMDAAPADPYEGSLLLDEPGVRGYEFAQRAHALAHFLRATQGAGALISLLSRRAPELRHVRRWMALLFQDPAPDVSNHLLAGWFATSAGGFMFRPVAPGDPYIYQELSAQD